MDSEIRSRILVDPKVCHGRPVICGTRVPVSIIVGSLASGMTADEIVREYAITREDIAAALEYHKSLPPR
jgi:uncharacterized protein (DUF433 family)